MLGVVDDRGDLASSLHHVEEGVAEILVGHRTRTEVVVVVDGPRELRLELAEGEIAHWFTLCY